MSRSPRRFGGVVLSIFLLAISVVLGGGGAANARASVDASAGAVPAPAARGDVAVVSLARQLHIPIGVAAQRIGWQRAALPAIPAIAAYLGSRYGGAWFDEAGKLHIGVVGQLPSAASIPAVSAARLSSVTAVNHVFWTEGQLSAVTAALSPMIQSVNAGSLVAITLRTVAPENTVEIVHGTGQLSALQRQYISAAQARFGTKVTVRTVAGTNWAGLDACVSPQRCDPPLRAGLEIDTPAAGCTSGPLVRSNSDNKIYVLTDGHCIADVGGANWTETFSNGEVHVIGNGHSFLFGGRDDEGLININNPTGWAPRAEIYVQAGPATTYNPTYPVRGSGGSAYGMRVCKAGAYYGTSCGSVIGLNVTGPSGIQGMGEANYYGGHGDSGAPVFASGIVYGLHESHYPSDSDASYDSYYVGITAALAHLNVHLATGT